MAFCMRCGKPLSEGVLFCTQCGAPVAEGFQRQVTVPEKPLAVDATISMQPEMPPTSADKTVLIQPEAPQEPAPAEPTAVIPNDAQSALTAMLPPEEAPAVSSYRETSGIDQFVMDIPPAAVVYPAPEPPSYEPPVLYQDQVYSAPLPPMPPQRESRWPIVVLVISIIVIIAAGAFAAWWFLLR